jgi:bacterioferritin-associated ferredoxin
LLSEINNFGVALANANDSHYIAHMIVCICHRVSDRDIAAAARQGCGNFEELQDELRVATACGACHDCARDTFHRHAHGDAHCHAGAHGHASAHGHAHAHGHAPSRTESVVSVVASTASRCARRIAVVAHREAAPAAGA